MSSAQKFAILEITFLLGTALAALPAAGIVLASGIVLLLCGWSRATRTLFLGIVFALIVGIAQYERAAGAVRHDPLAQRADTTVQMEATVQREPSPQLDGQQLPLAVTALIEGDRAAPVRSRLHVTTQLFPEYRAGDRLIIRCQLMLPQPKPGFAYDKILALRHVYAVCRQPRIIRHAGRARTVLQQFEVIRAAAHRRMVQVFPEPHASLLAGILLGEQRGLPDSVQQAFRFSGLSHIVALSGFNITILASALFAIALSLGMHRRHAFWMVCAGLVGFLLLTGLSASVVRAAIMGVFGLLARYLGRSQRIGYGLLFAGTVMVLLNPLVLLWDVGFQLSFLATLGLITTSAWWAGRLRFLPAALGMRESASATLSATAFTLPLLLIRFGMLSVISPLMNIIVLPAVPLAMLFGSLALVPGVQMVAAPLAWLLLTWVLWIAEVGAAVPGGHVPLQVPEWSILGIAGGVLLWWAWRRRMHIQLHT